MNLIDEHCYTASILIKASPQEIMTFLRDERGTGDWAFGAWGPITPLNDGIYKGRSLYDGGETIFRVRVLEQIHQVDYEVGYLGGELQPWIVIRITPGPVIGRNPETSLLSLIAWRNAEWADDDWRLLCATHQTEVYRLRYLIESC